MRSKNFCMICILCCCVTASVLVSPVYGGDITTPGDPIIGIPDNGNWPGTQSPSEVIDNNINTKYLHYDGDIAPSGFAVTPQASQSTVYAISFTTGGGASSCDPKKFSLYGSNDATLTVDGNWTPIIENFSTYMPTTRYFTGNPINFINTVAYTHYKVMFPTLRDAASAGSMQIAEVKLIGETEMSTTDSLFGLFDGLGAPAFLSDGTLTMEKAGWTPSAPGTWYDTALWNETDVFQTQLDYNDSTGLDWRIKIGKGGQLYSILLPGVGEIMHPQHTNKSPWNDAVCQATLFSDMHNTDPNMLGFGNGFIHQAGMYIMPELDALNNKPLYSPLLAEAFDAETGSYSVINWGLVPSPSVNRADALFYTDYRHLGDGVLEITYYFYNFGTYDIQQPTTPWTGLRGTVYGTQILGAIGGGFDVLPYVFENRRYYLEDTGGWIGHTEDPGNLNSPAYSLVQGIDKHRGQPGYEGQTQRMNGFNLDTGGFRAMATDMHCNIKPGEGIFFRYYMAMGTLGDVVAKSEQLVDNVDYGWLEFDEATAEFLPLYETTVSSQTILTTEVNGSAVAYSYAVPVKNSLPLILMKEISSGTYVLSTDPYVVCGKKHFENQYDPGHPEYSTYQDRVVYRPYDDNTEWIGLLGYVMPASLATKPDDCQPLSEILGEEIRFAPGEKLDTDELLIWTGQSPPDLTNNPPAFTNDKIVKSSANDNVAYNDTISGSASDPESDSLTYSKLLGPAWLNISADGSLSGTPPLFDAGLNTWSVQVSDGNGQPDTATLNITVSYDNTDAIVQWGQRDGQADIVGARIDGDAGSFDNVYNPAVPASPSDPGYYASSADTNRTPVFYAAGQRNNWHMEISGDIIGAYHYISPATTNQSMVVWQSADFMLTGVDVAGFNAQLYNRYSTDRGDLYWLVEKSGSWYISEMVGEFNSTAPSSISTADASSLTWYNFTPFGLDGNAAGVATIGSSPVTITMDDITSVGYFFETENTHATDNKWVGSKVLYFSVTATGYNPDINDDGSVNLKDFAKLSLWWKNDQCQTFVDCLDADINSDGIVDIMDLKIVTQRWLDSD